MSDESIKNPKNGKCIVPMLEATAKLAEMMEGEVDFILVAAFSMDEPIERNSIGQFLQFSDRAKPIHVAKMLHSLLVEYVMRNNREILAELAGASADNAVKEFMDKMRRSTN